MRALAVRLAARALVALALWVLATGGGLWAGYTLGRWLMEG